MKAITGKILLGGVVAVATISSVIYAINQNEVASTSESQQSAPVSDVQKGMETDGNSGSESAEISNEERAKELYNNPPANVNGQTENQTR